MSVDVQTNASDLREQYVMMGRSLDGALRKGMGRLVEAVERKAIANLTGGDRGPREYPIRRASGRLAGGMGRRIAGPLLGFVFNSKEYARANHEGFHPYNNRFAPKVPRRPFLDDAAEAVDGGEIIQRALREGLKL